jgi:hypothetical protein
VVEGGGLDVAWTWINFPYVFIISTLVTIFACTDWHEVQKSILAKEIEDCLGNDAESGERQSLLNGGTSNSGYGGN